jgi:hypothetical protein
MKPPAMSRRPIEATMSSPRVIRSIDSTTFLQVAPVVLLVLWVLSVWLRS